MSCWDASGDIVTVPFPPTAKEYWAVYGEKASEKGEEYKAIVQTEILVKRISIFGLPWKEPCRNFTYTFDIVPPEGWESESHPMDYLKETMCILLDAINSPRVGTPTRNVHTLEISKCKPSGEGCVNIHLEPDTDHKPWQYNPWTGEKWGVVADEDGGEDIFGKANPWEILMAVEFADRIPADHGLVKTSKPKADGDKS